MDLVAVYRDNIIWTVHLLAECIAKYFNLTKELTDDALADKMVELTKKLIAYDSSKMNKER